MRTRRTSIEIIADMLRLGESEVGKTRMMYSVNMSHSQLERYIDFLVSGEFLEPRRNGRNVKYITTRKGRSLLDNIDRMAEVLGTNGGAGSGGDMLFEEQGRVGDWRERHFTYLRL